MTETSAMRSVEWEPCLLERRPDPALTRAVRAQSGFVPPHLHYYTPAPWVARMVGRFGDTRLPLAHVDYELAELISLVVAQDNSCRFCYAVTRVMLQVLGYSEARIRSLEQNLATADLSSGTRAALDLARRVSRANPLPGPAALEPLAAAGIHRDAAREIVWVIGMNVLANRVTTLPAVSPEGAERLPESWAFRLARPFAGAFVRLRRGRVRALPLTPEMQRGPFAPIVTAFDGLLVATRLFQQIDEAWRSDILPRRTKALVVGVVGRALGCALSERAARRLLADEGFPEAALEQVLSDLTSPALTPQEAAIVPFARETVRYVPAQIQRRGRALRDALGAPAFVELLGWAGLTNALCRMTAVLVPQ